MTAVRQQLEIRRRDQAIRTANASNDVRSDSSECSST
jgi:hypothetical protein